MDSQNYIEYEIFDDVSGKTIFTRSRNEASAYFDKNWSVIERHIMVCRPSIFVSTSSAVSIFGTTTLNLKGVK
jgi:hypothetical protein